MRLKFRTWLVLIVAHLTPVVTVAECIPLGEFSKSDVGKFPSGWEPRKPAGRSIYVVMEENGIAYLNAKAKNAGIEADKVCKWDVKKFPILRWTWRPKHFPNGSNEKEGKNDSVLGVYVGFDNPSGSLKYVWSEKVATGTLINTGFLNRTKMLVVNSGKPKDSQQWVTVTRDIEIDFIDRFGRNAVTSPIGIAFLTDSDDTGSNAEGDYGNVLACYR